MKKILIAGMHSGAGKTTVSAAVMRALTLAGKTVAPFKSGPDYIDPMFHTFVTGSASSNLDAWMLDDETVRHLFYRNARGRDIAVIEGAMGLFDGCGSTDEGSSAHVARITDTPVVLVVDAKGVSRSIAAAINGFCAFDPSIRIAGVIFNKVSGERQYCLLKEIVAKYFSVPSLGYLPADPAIALESRHLGLIPAEELSNLAETIDRMASLASVHIDIDALVAAAGDDDGVATEPPHISALKECARGVRIAIARDKAFSFYYADNISLMEYAGIELVPFSPLADSHLPDNVQGVYLGGGYPEEFAAALSANSSLLADIKERAEAGLPIYAECGGLMYLTKGIRDRHGSFFPMVGFFACSSEMTAKLQRFGYVSIAMEDNTIRAHEFHHSMLRGEDTDAVIRYAVRKASTGDEWLCGLEKKNVLAGYAHIHFYANSDFFMRLVHRFLGEL